MYDRRRVFAAACLGMLVFGIMLTTLGAVLPSLIERFGIDKAEAGSLFLLMSFGILLGSLAFGPVVDRYGYKAPLLAAFALVLAALQGIAFASSGGLLRIAVLALGLGGGVINGGTNALVADISEGGRVAGLSLLGIFFGVGAVGVPFALAQLQDASAYGAIISAAGVFVLAPLAFTAALGFPAPKHALGFPLQQGLRLTRDPVLLLFGLALFLQSGMEITVGGWTAAYVQERLGLSGSAALLVLSIYWLGMMLARLALGSVFKDAAPARVLNGSVLLALAGSALLLGTASAPLAGAGVFLVGAGLAAGFPVVLGCVGDRYAALSGTAFSLVLAMALTGGMLLPYLTGVVGQGYGLRVSLLVVPAGLCGVALLFALATRRALGQPAPALPGG